MGHNHSQSGNSGSNTPVLQFFGAALAILIAILAFLNRGAIIEFSGRYLMLTKSDLMMIPVGVITFVLLWQALGRLVFIPYLRLLEEREQAGLGTAQLAAQLTHKASLISQDYEEKLSLARVAAAKARMRVLVKAKEQAAQLLREAQDSAMRHLEDARSVIGAEIKTQRETIMPEVEVLAGELTRKAILPPAPPGALFH